jgi:pyruvate ferredoxin oxidoreductase alpha subunit
MENAKQVILDVAKDFEKISGRKYGLIEEYRMEDAEYAVVIIGSAAGTTKDAIDHMRENGDKVGLIKIRSFRPFPSKEIGESLKKCKAVAVMDRSESFSTNGGPVGAETMQAMYTAGCTAKTINIMYGIGGRDVRVEDMIGVYETLKNIAATGETGETYRYMGLRDKEAK